jgi:DNA-directed RNA polymerase specialized sigma24 family protein
LEQRHYQRFTPAPGESVSPADLESFLIDCRSLKPEHRVCLTLRYLHGMNRSEIATHTGLTENQVKSCLQYGLQLLRKALDAKTR